MPQSEVCSQMENILSVCPHTILNNQFIPRLSKVPSTLKQHLRQRSKRHLTYKIICPQHSISSRTVQTSNDHIVSLISQHQRRQRRRFSNFKFLQYHTAAGITGYANRLLSDLEEARVKDSSRALLEYQECLLSS